MVWEIMMGGKLCVARVNLGFGVLEIVYGREGNRIHACRAPIANVCQNGDSHTLTTLPCLSLPSPTLICALLLKWNRLCVLLRFHRNCTNALHVKIYAGSQ